MRGTRGCGVTGVGTTGVTPGSVIVIVVVGGVLGFGAGVAVTSHVTVALVLPASSVARTAIVCSPSASVKSRGGSHRAAGASSTLQTKPTPASSAEKYRRSLPPGAVREDGASIDTVG